MDVNTKTINEINSKFSDELSKRFLQYALSTITSRSLPDVRDGLKPVHRRLLYAMNLLNLLPNKSFKKSARVVGDVMGKYHPHGDTAIYESMVRMAQNFSMNFTLVEGQGNFGNIDGDNAAAMRYTEARLSEVSKLLLEGINENAVDFRDTYDGSGKEPVLLPSGFPNLLVNGAQGIAVGMACSIPSHNLNEICEAAKLLIENRDICDEKILNVIKGPDFPTGGTIIEPQSNISQAYTDGKGSFRLRSNWFVEKKSSGTWQICIYEIPYQIQKSKIIEKIAELILNKKLIMISDVRDESSDDIRIIIEPKSRNIKPRDLMEILFRLTDLETRVQLNLNVLDENGTPNVMSIKNAIISWVDHRRNVLIRVKEFTLNKISHRLEVLESYLKVYINLDEIIAIIREDDNPKNSLIKKFKLSETQALAILDMKLRNLRKLEEQEIIIEKNKLLAEKHNLDKLLKSPTRQWREITKQISNIKDIFKNETSRRTIIDNRNIEYSNDISLEIEKEPITVIVSKKGWIKTIKGHLSKFDNIKFKEGDELKLYLCLSSTDNLSMFADNGRFYNISVYKLPSGRGFGEPISIIFEDILDHNILFLSFTENEKLLLVSSDGRGFIVESKDTISKRKSGKQVLNLKNNNRAIACLPLNGDLLAIVGENRKILILSLEEIPQLSKGQGVILQRYKNGKCSDAKIIKSNNGLTWSQGNDRTRTEKDLTTWIGRRGGMGKMPPRGFPKPPKFK